MMTILNAKIYLQKNINLMLIKIVINYETIKMQIAKII